MLAGVGRGECKRGAGTGRGASRRDGGRSLMGQDCHTPTLPYPLAHVCPFFQRGNGPLKPGTRTRGHAKAEVGGGTPKPNGCCPSSATSCSFLAYFHPPKNTLGHANDENAEHGHSAGHHRSKRGGESQKVQNPTPRFSHCLNLQPALD